MRALFSPSVIRSDNFAPSTLVRRRVDLLHPAPLHPNRGLCDPTIILSLPFESRPTPKPRHSPSNPDCLAASPLRQPADDWQLRELSRFRMATSGVVVVVPEQDRPRARSRWHSHKAGVQASGGIQDGTHGHISGLEDRCTGNLHRSGPRQLRLLRGRDSR